MSKMIITQRYKKLMLDIDTPEFFAAGDANSLNCYVCDGCGEITKTVNVDRGVTPMMIKCRHCNDSMAVSTFYRDVAIEKKPTHEWYRPTLKKLLKAHAHPGMVEHVLNGGLELREISPLTNNIYSMRSIYPFAELEVGGTFTANFEAWASVRVLASVLGKNLGRKFKVKKTVAGEIVVTRLS